MSIPQILSELPLETKTQLLPLITTISLTLVVVVWFAIDSGKSEYPLANPPRWFQTELSKRLDFLKNGIQVYNEARKRYGDKPYRLIMEYGECLVLSSNDLRVVQTEKNLNFGKAIASDFNSHIPGFSPYGVLGHEKALVQNMIKKHLTKLIGEIISPLSDETDFAISHIFGEEPEWKEARISDCALDLVARISSRIFLGEELCRNEAWLHIMREYTVKSFKAGFQMTVCPKVLKFVLPWVAKEFKVVLQMHNEARAIMTPVIENRRQIKAEAKRKGEPIPVYNDALEWGELESEGAPYDPQDLQLLLSFAAIHTTSNLLGQTMTRLANEPHLIPALREEIIQVLQADGLSKNGLYNLKLLDSTLKETQRIMPDSPLNLRRVATKDFVTSNGIKVKEGDRFVVDTSKMSDPEVYPNPTKFDIYRYYRMRQDPDTAAKSQLVSTSVENLTFGFGNHACPGRFFAANELKLALCHLLLKYDWELSHGASVESVLFGGSSRGLNPENKLKFRRRKAELDLNSLVYA